MNSETLLIWVTIFFGLLISTGYIPQIARIIGRRSSDDVSLEAFALLWGSLIVFGGYGFYRDYLPLKVCPTASCSLLSILLIVAWYWRSEENRLADKNRLIKLATWSGWWLIGGTIAVGMVINIDQTIENMAMVAGLLISVSYWPQIVRIRNRRSSEDVSVWTFLLTLVGVVFWLIYAWCVHDIVLIVSNVTTLTLVVILMVLIIKYRKPTETRKE